MALRIPALHSRRALRPNHPEAHLPQLLAMPTAEPAVAMVQLGERGWTSDALHAACQRARTQRAAIVIVAMMPVQHLSWLGTDLGNRSFSGKVVTNVQDCLATVEDYGLQAEVFGFQYSTWLAGTLRPLNT